MSYSQAIEKAWENVQAIMHEERTSIRFLSDTYDIYPASKRVISTSCGIAAKDHVAIILLHYLAKKLAFGTLPRPSGEWIDFNELEGGEGYYPAFKKRTIDPLLRKYGPNPEALLTAMERLPAKKAAVGNTSIIAYPFEEVAIMVKVSKADEEFGPDANILFDKNISGIFCTEDIVVLTEILIHQL